jgi:hypothetical protein
VSFDLRHALAVASRFPYPSDEWLTALLHDAIEDGDVDQTDLASAWLPSSIVRSVVWLTRRRGETYEDYIDRVKTSPLARRVKVADLETNLARLDPAHESLRPRYERALRTLKETDA